MKQLRVLLLPPGCGASPSQGYPQQYDTWPKLFKGWIALSTGYISIQWITQLVSLTLIYWIVIYPGDSAIQLLNNWGQYPFIHLGGERQRGIKFLVYENNMTAGTGIEPTLRSEVQLAYPLHHCVPT